MKNTQLLDAFSGRNTKVPVWFMRQAGRSLPEYQAYKTQYSLDEMFHTPKLASEITCLPVDILNVDAAIMFADILTMPKQMGMNITFDNLKGPIVKPLKDIDSIHDFKDLDYIKETIRLIKIQLQDEVPLIGFVGSPFTVLTYMCEGGSSLTFKNTLRLMNEKPEQFHSLMRCLTDNTIRYLKLQQDAGIDVFQIFGSWDGILRLSDFNEFVLPYIQDIFSNMNLPSIYFIKNCSHLLEPMENSGADFLSVCQTVDLNTNEAIQKTSKGIQGNLYNALLYADQTILKKEIDQILKFGKKHKKFIFNLSHGLMPDTPVDNIKCAVDYIHAQSL